PLNRLTREQAAALEKYLMREFGEEAGVEFKTYIAMRYWHPFSEEAAEQMRQDGINKVVLLPLYPHYSKTTTGSGLIYWYALQEEGEIPRWDTTYVLEYSTNQKYVQAVSESIDVAYQRFQMDHRSMVHLLFYDLGTTTIELEEWR